MAALDLSRIKSNVAKMVGMGAPESDIDAYIAGEGATIDQVRAFQQSALDQASANASQMSQKLKGTVPKMPTGPRNQPGAFQTGVMQGLGLGWTDELMAAGMTPIELGVRAAQGKPFDVGAAYQAALARNQQSDQQAASQNPGANFAGEMVGAVMNPVGQASLTSLGAGTLAKAGIGTAEGAGLGALYGAGKGNTGQERLQGAGVGAITGGVLGAAAPVVGNLVGGLMQKGAQKSATNAAIKGAPDAAGLKSAASQMFQQVDQSGVAVDTGKFSQLVQNLVSQAKKLRINPTLDPKATAAYQEMIQALADVQSNGGALAMSDMHTLRQIAQKAAMSSEGRDAMFANMIVDGIDKFVTQPGATNATGNTLMEAISTWSRARKVGLIEEAIFKAGNQASGVENGLRTQFRAIIQNPKLRKLFTQQELSALTKVANGTPLSNVARVLGHLGFDFGSGRNFLGGMIGASAGGALGGLPGAIAAGAVGSGARLLNQKMAQGAANRAAQIIATPNIPQVPLPMLPSFVAPLALGGNVARQQFSGR